MRRAPMLCRVALAGGATLLALTACSGGSNNAGSSSSTARASTSSAAATTSSSAPAAAGDAAGFCGRARTFVAQVQAAVAAQSQQKADVAQNLQTLVGALQGITPPPAIATDWQTATSDLQQLAQAYQGVDLSDPQAVAQMQQKIAPVEQQLGTAGQHIDAYLESQCGISSDETASTTG